jgi:hypothetical protein
MKDDNEEKLKKHLVALLHLFKDKPNLLVNYVLQYGSFKKDFKDRIINNTKLEEIYDSIRENREIEKPYFVNLDEMHKYYDEAFRKYSERVRPHPVLNAATDKEALTLQLENAVAAEDYERAAKIRDYMIELGLKDESLRD